VVIPVGTEDHFKTDNRAGSGLSLRMEAGVRLKILVVEDDDLQAKVLAGQLEHEDLYVDVVNNGLDAIRRINSGIFDVALIDYRIPHVNGVAVAKIIHSITGPAVRPRLIALTGAADELRQQTAKAVEPDFDAIVAKPFTMPTLMATIRRCYAEAPPRANKALRMPDRPPQVASASVVCPPRARVLVVDDDATLRGLLQMALQTEGYAVDCAANGLEALNCISTTTYDVALIDYRMPELDGLGTAKLIYDLLDRRHRPRLVALTGAIDDLMVEDPHYGLLFDNVVMKSEGVPTMLSAVRASLNYLRLRANQPVPNALEHVRADRVAEGLAV